MLEKYYNETRNLTYCSDKTSQSECNNNPDCKWSQN